VGAQPRPYVVVRLAHGVTLQLPRNWRVLSDNQMVTLEAAVVARNAKIGEADFSSDLTFAANYYDEEQKWTAGIVNVRYYPEQTISQRDVRGLSPAELRAVDEEGKRELTRALSSMNVKLLSWVGTSRRTINAMTAIVVEFRRAGLDGVFRVRLVRVLDGVRSFTLTASYREDQVRLLEPITSYVISTLRRA
jgi:hypothetical protein